MIYVVCIYACVLMHNFAHYIFVIYVKVNSIIRMVTVSNGGLIIPFRISENVLGVLWINIISIACKDTV